MGVYHQCLRYDEILYVVDNTIMGFPADDDSVKAEVTAVNQLISQYLNPLINGMVDDTDGGITDLNERMDQAGIEKFMRLFPLRRRHIRKPLKVNKGMGNQPLRGREG